MAGITFRYIERGDYWHNKLINDGFTELEIMEAEERVTLVCDSYVEQFGNADLLGNYGYFFKYAVYSRSLWVRRNEWISSQLTTFMDSKKRRLSIQSEHRKRL
ncbi:hypothetical protein [Vibrio parahaemolyticus]|uniref:hypothetical protein n=1 Tax=Vibrio parahaemolyticus TaxID=670 RepID=UPI00387AFD02